MDYLFEWRTLDSRGKCDGVFEQQIFGATLCRAVEYFEGYHGKVGNNECGGKLQIVSIKESN